MRGVRRAITAAIGAAAVLAGAHTAAAATVAAPVWLCKPGLASDPCVVSQKTGEFTPGNRSKGLVTPKAPATPAVDCFYVYPTVSDQRTPIADLEIEPAERSIARAQAARFAPYCRMYAPMYRQITVPALNGDTLPVSDEQRADGYDDVVAAWHYYLAHFNKGRGVILLGHSQGSFELRSLISTEIDKKPAERKLLVSAVLLGGNVLVKKGSDRGGDFAHIRACTQPDQVQCVIAFSSFDETPPDDTLFGNPAAGFQGATPAGGDEEVLCTNPAALGGGTAKLDSIFPAKPFAPGTSIAASLALLGQTLPKTSAAWVEYRDAYSAACVTSNGANVLMVKPRAAAAALKPAPTAQWGLHLVDANIALGNIVADVKAQIAAWTDKHPATKPTTKTARAAAAPKPVWLCRPGLAHDPCTPDQSTTTFFTPVGKPIATRIADYIPGLRRPIDCFYVYPTVSRQKTAIANLTIDPEERTIALNQAARFSLDCDVYAPMYRQGTLNTVTGAPAPTPAERVLGFSDVLAAFRSYLAHDNHGRGFVLIGHSQGSYELEVLIHSVIDPNPKLRRRLVSAIVPGGNVTVKDGSDVGGTFTHVPACRSDTQLHCVIAYSMFDQPPPADAIFGRANVAPPGAPSAPAGTHVLCTNPARLGGGTGALHVVYPNGGQVQPVFATHETGQGWSELDTAYTARCSAAGGADVLQVTAHGGGPVLPAVPSGVWGLHVFDVNLALGNLVDVVARQAQAYVKRDRAARRRTPRARR